MFLSNFSQIDRKSPICIDLFIYINQLLFSASKCVTFQLQFLGKSARIKGNETNNTPTYHIQHKHTLENYNNNVKWDIFLWRPAMVFWLLLVVYYLQ